MNRDCENILMLYENTMQQPTMKVDANGTKTWKLDGKLHREDGPAIEHANGSKAWWYLHGKLHREDGPAIEHANGDKEWYLHGKRHREDGPAIDWVSGTKAWWLNDKYHREDGPAIEYANGDKAWYLNDAWYEDAFEWAEALLKSKGSKKPSEDEINSKVQQVTSKSILD